MPGVGSTSTLTITSPVISPFCFNSTVSSSTRNDVLSIIRSVTSICSPNNSNRTTIGPESPVGLLSMATPTEKPSHYRYLKEFRVEQCLLFPQHKCQQHRPFTCFNWHFPNQRRRRPVRRRDGTFNYSPDAYCTKYDETTGTCPDGDDCALLHRTAGDTERRYHLRYFKTCMCVYETDNRGFCTKNGAHCAFAHGDVDKRPPVFDIREQQNPEPAEDQMSLNGPNQLDKERNMMIDDPKWQDASYVLAHYKTEPCKRPPRLCRQGYACPQYHNQRDRRRSPKIFKYRSTPCPNVKHGDEWGEPTACDQEDECPYCHTRTEQQFHPEIYKSSKCHDVFTSQYCPRGPFCAFAHTDAEMQINRNLPLEANLADLLSNALPSSSTSSSTILPKTESNNNNHILELNGSSSNAALNMNNNIGNGGNSSGVDIFSSGGKNTSALESPSSDYGSAFGHLNNSGGSAFGTQSFASAVSASYSSAASGGLNNGGGSSKLFRDDGKKDVGCLDALEMNLTNSKSSNPALITGPALMESLSRYPDNTESENYGYSLFGAPSVSRTSRDEFKRDDSPPAIDKDGDSEHFGGSDISSLSGTNSKPVSIPSPGYFQQTRDRFPSGSSPMTNSIGTYQPLGPIMNKLDALDQGNDFLSNHSPFYDFVPSPRQSTLPNCSTPNGYLHTPLPSRTIGSGINSGSSGLGLSNQSTGPGLIGSSAGSSIMGPSLNAVGTNGGNGGSPGYHPQIGQLISQLGMARGYDFTYLSYATLRQYHGMLKYQMEQVEKALLTHTEGHPSYSCLNCEGKDKYRSVTLVPCEHQVLCVQCANIVANCPLCHTPIQNRKYSTLNPGSS